MALDFKRKTLGIITGASQGIGRQIAIDVAKKIAPDSLLVLIARSESGLEETKALITDCAVKTYSMDLSTADIELYNDIFEQNKGKFDNALIFHNAGSLGTLDTVNTYTDLKTWQEFFDLNLFSVSLLNAAYLNAMRGNAERIYVINITSLCGSQPFINMGMYGTAKAARNLFFKVMAEEEPDVQVLNYSPGPVDTDMVSDVIANVKDEGTKSMFTELKESATILKAEDTVAKMLGILEKGEYKSGDIVDFYERV